MRMTIDATALEGTDVDYVSMVKHAANKLPFRVVKQDGEPMLDLSKAFRGGFKKSEPTASIIGIVTAKGVSDEITNAALKAAGIEADKAVKTEHDDHIQYLVPGTGKDAASAAFVVTMKHDVGLVVANSPLIQTAITNVKKAFSGYDWESTDFGSVMGSGGYCSGISTASDMLDLTIANIMQKAENPAAAADDVKKACEAFTAYVADLTKALPERAFKADQTIAGLKVEAVVKGTSKPSNAPDNWDALDEPTKSAWVKKNPVQKGTAPAGGWNTTKPDKAPDGWGSMSDEDKHKWNTKAAAKKEAGEFDLSKLPDERPAWLSVEKFDALKALKKEAGAAKKTDVWPKECPTFMTPKAYAELYKSETGEDWPQGDLTNGHGGGFSQGNGTGTNPDATQDDKTVPKNLGNDTQTPAGALTVHKSVWETMKAAGAPQGALDLLIKSAEADIRVRFNKAITFDPTKDQSVQWAELGDGKGFSDAKAPPKGTADEDYEKSIDTRARAALGMRKADTSGPGRAASAQSGLDGSAGLAMDDGNVGTVAAHAANGQVLDDGTSGSGSGQGSGAGKARKGEDEGIARVLAALEGVKSSFEGKLADVTKDIGGLKTTIAGVETRIEKAETAVHGTALSSDSGGDVVRKADGRLIGSGDGDGSDIPLLDTAYSRRRAA